MNSRSLAMLAGCFFLFTALVYSSPSSSDTILSIPKTESRPVIDGELDNMWHQLYKTRIDRHVTSYNAPDDWLDLFGFLRMTWDSSNLYLFIDIMDDNLNTSSGNAYENDGIELYFDGDNSKNSQDVGYDANDQHWTYVYGKTDGSIAPHGAHAWKRTETGYILEASIPVSDLNFNLEEGLFIGFELQINDNDNGSRQHIGKWWEETDNSWLEPGLFGTAQLESRTVDDLLGVPYSAAVPVIDGQTDAIWQIFPEVSFNTYTTDVGDPVSSMSDWDDLQMSFRSLWTDSDFCLLITVIDDEIRTPSGSEYENDSIEIYFDGNNSKNSESQGYDSNDLHWRWVYKGSHESAPDDVDYAWLQTEDGYQLELRIPARDLSFPLENSHAFGFDIQINDNDGSYRSQIAKWYAPSDDTWLNPSLFGTARLVRNSQSTPPLVSLTSPQDGAIFYEGSRIDIQATASDPDGSVSRVEFYAGSEKIGEDETEPYVMSWSGIRLGDYTLTALAIDNTQDFNMSNPVAVTVTIDSSIEKVKKPDFSVERGFYKSPFNLIVSSETEGATIYYTVDGSTPVVSSSRTRSDATPLTIQVDPASSDFRAPAPGFVVRAFAVKEGMRSSKIVTQTYLFVNQVAALSPENQKPDNGWPEPSAYNGQWIDYGMDPSVYNDSKYKNSMEDAFTQISTISLVTDLGNLFDPDSGIYVNCDIRGTEWERQTSVEQLNPDGSEGFQIDAGLRMRGGWSRHDENPKHAFRLFFREKYGKGKLEYPLFGDEGVDEFDKVDLRTAQNYSWSYYGDSRNTMVRDVFSRDLQREMGQPYTRSRYYHLYINGVYWGLFQSQERAEAHFAASYLGGDDDDYDTIKEDWAPGTVKATDGNLDAWEDVWNLCVAGFASDAGYFKLQGQNADGTRNSSYDYLVDIDNLIDYMLVIFYAGNFDAPCSKFGSNASPHNFYSVYNRNGQDGFKFFIHDAEHTLLPQEASPGIGLYENRVNIGDISGNYRMNVGSFYYFHPQWLHYKLSDSKEYRLRFADHVYKYFFNNGLFTPDTLSALLLSRAVEIDKAIIAESARWGNTKSYRSLTQRDWQSAVDDIVEDWFPYRTEIVLDQLKDEDLYPDMAPPVFSHNSQVLTQALVSITAGYRIDLANPNSDAGSIYYTTDGTDPRSIGGSVSSGSVEGGDATSVVLQSGTTLKARIKNGNTWSALHTIDLMLPSALNTLAVTELHYHPTDNGEVNDDEYEFIELKNLSSGSLNLSFASFADGIDYSFPSGSVIEGNGFVVLASNAQEFAIRYGFAPFGEYSGQLNNGGEHVALVSASGDTVLSFTYDDKDPWPEEADGGGYSLVSHQENPTDDPDDPDYWKLSATMNGSPGADDSSSPVAYDMMQPASNQLLQNYPNPFNPSTTLSFTLSSSSHVTLIVYDIQGREIETLLNGNLEAGLHLVQWRARGLASGTYLYRLITRDYTETRRFILQK